MTACGTRSKNLTSSSSTTISSVSCQAFSNPNPVAITTDAAGAIVGTAPTVAISLSANQPVRLVTSQISRSAGLQFTSSASGSSLQAYYTIQAKPLDAIS